MAPGRITSRGRANKVQWERTRRILALVPPKGVSSDSGSSSEDEVIIQNVAQRRRHLSESTYCSSEPKSLPSSIENLNISDTSENDCSHISQSPPPILSDEETVPLE